MKYLKMFGLTMLVAAALTSITGAGSASATELTCEPGVMCPTGTFLHGGSEGHVVFDAIIGKIECNGTLEGNTSNTGGPSETVSGSRTGFTITNCTGSVTITTLQVGTMEIHENGTVTSTGTEGTVETFGFHCIFKTNNTDLGTLTGSSTTGKTATFDISGVIPRTGGRSGAFCGASAPITGSGIVDTPMFLDVH